MASKYGVRRGGFGKAAGAEGGGIAWRGRKNARRTLAINFASDVFGRIWSTLRAIVEAFIEDDALSHGAAIAFYAATALVPILYIVITIAGGLFGPDVARGAAVSDLRRLIGPQIAALLRSVLKNASYISEGFFANAVSVITLIVVASGAFGEMRTALNTVWRAAPKPTTIWHLLRMRIESLGLVVVLAVLLLTSMVVTILISAAGANAGALLPASPFVLQAANAIVTWLATAVLFAAIYRILPDKDLKWHDVTMGGTVTALLFQIGQFAISSYLGSSRAVSVYGAAGGLMALLLWIYYSAEIFLFGAEVTKVYTEYRALAARQQLG